MLTRFAWVPGVVVLVSLGLLVACATTYKASSDGLVIVATQGTGEVQAFAYSLGNGHISQVGSPPLTTGVPSLLALDPTGNFAYVVVNGNGIQSYKVDSSGTLTPLGSVIPDPNPVAMAVDSAGKFLFVAEGLNVAVNSYTIGSDGTLTSVPGTYVFPPTVVPANLAALASSPTVFPYQNAVCSTSGGNNAPTTEYLYVADSANYVVWQFGVDTSSGALTNPPGFSQAQSFTTGPVPSGVAVDSCNRFVYASNQQNNTISAFTICNGLSTQSEICTSAPLPPGGLVPVIGSPFSLPGSSSGGGANGPGPLLVDPFGNFLYVLNTGSNTIAPFHISPVSGSLTSQTVVAAGLGAKWMAIRSDDNWLFVSNYTAATISQYSITPATGVLTPLPITITDNYPWGIAVK